MQLNSIFRKQNVPYFVIAILAIALVISIGQCYLEKQSLVSAEKAVKSFQHDQKILDFTKLFISKVLKADGEVSFDDRLKLESSVRDINDKTVFDQWQKFIGAKTSLEAQIEVKNLLELLINKIIF